MLQNAKRKLHNSVRRVNPVGLNERRELFSWRIHQPIYYVPHPHYLWHLDGNHKLICWGFVIHAAIMASVDVAFIYNAMTISNPRRDRVTFVPKRDPRSK